MNLLFPHFTLHAGGNVGIVVKYTWTDVKQQLDIKSCTKFLAFRDASQFFLNIQNILMKHCCVDNIFSYFYKTIKFA